MGCLMHDPLFVQEGSLMLRLPGGGEIPLTGLTLSPGWRVTLLFTGIATTWLLDLVHESGEEGTLFIAPEGRLITHEIERLPDHDLAGIARAVQLWRERPDHPATDDALAGYRMLNRRIRARIPLSGFLPEIGFQPLAQTGPAPALRQSDGGVVVICQESREPIPGRDRAARFVLTLFDPLFVVEFEATYGRPMTWFVHRDGRFFGTSLDSVPNDLLVVITQRGARLMREIETGDGRFDLMRLLDPRARLALAALFSRNDNAGRLDGRQSRLAHAGAGQTFKALETLVPHQQQSRFAQRASGWFMDAVGYAWIVGTSSFLQFEAPQQAQVFRLRLDISTVREGHRMTLCIGGSAVGSYLLTKTQGSCLTFFIPPELVGDDPLRVDFQFDPPLSGADSAFRLDCATLSTGPARSGSVQSSEPDLLDCFSNLGVDCELGFAQRHFGIEPLGLFRFAGVTSLAHQIRLIETEFAGLGAPGSLRCTVNTFRGEDEYMIWADSLGLFYHTWRSPRDIDAAGVLAENETKLAYLGRKLVEDLEDGEKIFVYKTMPACGLSEALSLHAALNRFGRNRLFWITPLEPGCLPGDVEWVAPDLLRGYSGSINIAEEPDIEAWLLLCRRAYKAFNMIAAEPVSLALPPLPDAPVSATSALLRDELQAELRPDYPMARPQPAPAAVWPAVAADLAGSDAEEPAPAGAFARLRARLKIARVNQ